MLQLEILDSTTSTRIAFCHLELASNYFFPNATYYAIACNKYFPYWILMGNAIFLGEEIEWTIKLLHKLLQSGLLYRRECL